MSTAKIKVICVVGATASGKSSLSLALAERLNGEIISADALAVYKDMNIGTAKPTEEELSRVKHHCVSVFDTHESCNVQEWFELANNAMLDIHSRGKAVILAGGTPLYFKLFLEGISAGPPKDESIRKNLEDRYDNEGKEVLFDYLKKVDAGYAENRHPNDKKRVVRALEVFEISGKPFSSFHADDDKLRDDIEPVVIGLKWDKEELHKRINLRCKNMFENGLIDEVKRLQGKMSKQAQDGVGYKEIVAYLDREYDYEHALYQVKLGTRHLAKHQMTWYRRFRFIKWLAGDDEKLIDKALDIIKNA